MEPRRVLCLGVLGIGGWAFVGSWALWSCGVSAAAQQPQFKSGVERVLVDVQVVDRQGQPIENLGPGDFDVRFNRDPRPVASVEFLRAASATTPAGGSTAGSQGFVA